MIFAADQQKQRLKWAFESCKNGAWGNEPDGEDDAVCVRAADFDGQSGRLNDGERTLRSVDAATFKKVALRPGDLVMEKSGGGEKQLVGRTVVFKDERPSVCSNFLARCRPVNNIDPAYLNYLMLAIYVGRGTYPHIKQSTGIQNLDLGSYLDVRVSIPDLPVQQRIARFLDEKTARIDALIEKKQALLERLSEKRQALITRAVTKGLNPDVAMKPSGVDWLGDVPSHWNLVPFKWSCRVRSGQVDPRDELYSDLPLVAPDHIESASGRIAHEVQSAEEQGAISGKYLCQPGDVIYSKIRPSLRKVAQCNQLSLCSADMYAINVGEKLDRDFIFYFLLTDAFTFYAELESMRVAMPKVNREALGAFVLPLPPNSEQHAIAQTCADVDANERKQSDLVRASLERLAEYRSTLITAAVSTQPVEVGEDVSMGGDS